MSINLQNNDKVIPSGKVLVTIRDAKTGRIKYEGLHQNMFVTAGKNSVASRLIGTNTSNKGSITYAALGTGTTAPELSDTMLQTELVRKTVSVRSVVNNVATFETFFTTSEGNGTLREAGLFGDDASSTPGSGTLFCRVAINRTKTSNDTLSLAWAVTIG